MNNSSELKSTAIKSPFNIGEWIKKGLNWNEYLAGCKKNVERMKSIYGRVTVPEKSTEFFREKGPMTIVCISEDWCPDCAQNVPLIVRLTERLPGTSVRFFFRDRNGALMDHYQTSGKRVVPTAVFFDSELNELGKWAGPSRKAKAWTNETLIRGRQISEIPRKELEEFGSLYDEKFLNEFYLDTLDELKSALG